MNYLMIKISQMASSTEKFTVAGIYAIGVSTMGKTKKHSVNDLSDYWKIMSALEKQPDFKREKKKTRKRHSLNGILLPFKWELDKAVSQSGHTPIRCFWQLVRMIQDRQKNRPEINPNWDILR